jgi:hypothetical protein
VGALAAQHLHHQIQNQIERRKIASGGAVPASTMLTIRYLIPRHFSLWVERKSSAIGITIRERWTFRLLVREGGTNLAKRR